VFIELQQQVDKFFGVLFNLLEFLAGLLPWHTQLPSRVSVKGDLPRVKRDLPSVKRDLPVSKETYNSVKRDLIVSPGTRNFPPGSVSKETYRVSKETY